MFKAQRKGCDRFEKKRVEKLLACRRIIFEFNINTKLKVKAMRKLGIIDFHAHIFPEKIADKAVESIGAYYGVKMVGRGTVEGLIESGKKIGVEKYIVHSTATKVEQVKSINDFIYDAVASTDCLIGFGTLHPDLEDLDAEVERIISMGLKGIKLHPEFQDFFIDGTDMMPVYKAVEGKLPILMHMGDENKTSSSPGRLAKVLDRFPKLTVIAAHLGGYEMWDEAIDCLVGSDIYLDTSSSLFKLDRDKAERIIRGHGIHKVLFGTDYPMWSHEEELERFKSLSLSEYEQELILKENAGKLLEVFGYVV
ncbi:MAG: amidohydrolase family protein [Clostridia bacterium]|nr:amidohydrolase family protein [Clostridia bacterium]